MLERICAGNDRIEDDEVALEIMDTCIVFWQRMLTPHMTELARHLGRLGVEVHYVAEEGLSPERRAMGWSEGELPEVTAHVVSTPESVRHLVNEFPQTAVHITQGVRSNGLIGEAQRYIAHLRLRQFPIMEMVDLRGGGRWIKPLVYAMRLVTLSSKIEGLLAIGAKTPGWVRRWSLGTIEAIPFAYFLAGAAGAAGVPPNSPVGPYRFIFVGALIERKRVDLVLSALGGLAGEDFEFEFEIVGDGPERAQLERQAAILLPGRVKFVGTLAMEKAIHRIAMSDCLVLPSDHDGWGAVVSEAQINGVPVVCSDGCGASGTVIASGSGGVFPAGDPDGLRHCLAGMLAVGRLDEEHRGRLTSWAEHLTAKAGAHYLLEIVSGHDHHAHIPPWQRDGIRGV